MKKINQKVLIENINKIAKYDLDNKPYIDDTSIEKPNIKFKKYESLKSIKKKVLTKNQNI